MKSMKTLLLSLLMATTGLFNQAHASNEVTDIKIGDVLEDVLGQGRHDGMDRERGPRGPRGPRRPPRRPSPTVHICTHKPDPFKTDTINCDGQGLWAQGVMIDVEKNDADIDFVDVFFANGDTERLYRFRGRFNEGVREYDYFRPGRVVRVRVGATSPNVFGKSRLQVYLLQR